MHCDTLMMAYMCGKEDIYEMPYTLDLKRMREGNQLAQFFAIFFTNDAVRKFFGREEAIDDREYFETCRAIFLNSTEKYGDFFAAACSYDDIIRNEREGKMSGLLTIEDGRCVDNSLDKLKEFYDAGVRLISLTWNYENCFGFPHSQDPDMMQKGLKTFGKEAIQYMNELGMLIDVSHLSDGGFWDCIEISKAPIVASHSNARSLSPHTRNLTDAMIKAIAEKGGLIGINFGPEFLNKDITSKTSTVDLIVQHIKHLVDVGGVEVVGLGSDFDGIMGELEVDGPHKDYLIFDALQKAGYSSQAIEKIAYKNALRVIQDTLKNCRA